MHLQIDLYISDVTYNSCIDKLKTQLKTTPSAS
jgi:copper chaperone CopZ